MMKMAGRICALLLSIALVATAPGLAPYEALAQFRPVAGAPVEAPELGLPSTVDGVNPADVPMDSLGAAPLSEELSLGESATRTTESAQRLGGRSAVSATSLPLQQGLRSAPIQKIIKPIKMSTVKKSWTPSKGADAARGWSEGAQKFDRQQGLNSAPVDNLSEDAPLSRALTPATHRGVQVAVQPLNAAPQPKPAGNAGRTILGGLTTTARVALGAGAVVGLHIGAATLLPNLFGFTAAPSLWAVASAPILLTVALVARARLAKVAEYPSSRGPRWMMDAAIGGVLGAGAAAFPQYMSFLPITFPAATAAHVVSLGPLLGMVLMTVTTTVAFYLPYVTASIRGRSFQKSEPKDGPIRRAGKAFASKFPNFHYKLKTGLVIGTLVGFTGLLGATVFGLKSLGINLLIAGAITGLMYFLSDKLIIAAMKGKEAPESQYPELYRMIRKIAKEYNVPMPKVYIVPMGVPNAFATGRDPAHAVVGVTPEAMALFTEEELEGVIGHEMSHVVHRDMLISAILGGMATAIAFCAYSVLWSVTHIKAGAKALYDKVRGRGSKLPGDRSVQDGAKKGDGQKPEVFDPLTGGIALANAGGILRAFAAVWAPIIATMLQMAGTRTREFAADEGGAKVTKNPRGLAKALTKLMNWKPGPGFQFDRNRAPFMLALSPYFTVSPLEQLNLQKDLRLPQFSWSPFFWIGLGVVYGLLTGWSAPAKFVNIGFFAWQFFGSKPLFNLAWLGALGYAVATGWHAPVTLLVFAFLGERVANWTVAALKKMLPREGQPNEDADEFLFRRFVSHPATGERIRRLNQMGDAMDSTNGPTPPAGPTFGAKPEGDGPQGQGLHAAPVTLSGRTGLDGRLLPAVQKLKGRLEIGAGSKDLAHLGWALNELLASGGSVGYADTRPGGQPVLSRFDPATRSIQVSESLRHADPELQAALLAASLQEAFDHLEGRASGTREQAERRMEVVNAYLETREPSDLARGLDLNNPAETGLFESLMTNRLLHWQGGTSVDRKIGHLPTVERLIEDAKSALKLAEKEKAELASSLRLVDEPGAAARTLGEEIAILEAEIKVGAQKLADLKREAKSASLGSNSRVAAIELDELPIRAESRGPSVEPALEPVLELMRGTISKSPELRDQIDYALDALEELTARGGRVLFGATPAGQAAYFSSVTRELVVNDAYRRIPAALLGALIVHELTHADDAFGGRSMTRETEHRAFSGMAQFLAAFPPKAVAAELEPNNPAAVQAFQWMYSVRRQYLRGKTTLEAMVANTYTQLFHAQFVGHQSAAGTLSDFRTRTLAPARERLEGLREHERRLSAALARTGDEPERERQLHATRESIQIIEGLVTMYERMESQYAKEARSE